MPRRPRIGVISRLALAATMVASAAVVPSGGAAVQAAGHPVLTAVGDVNRCGTKAEDAADDATAELAKQVDGPIAILGDWVEGKVAGEIENCVSPTGWGSLKSRIRPTPGDNGEYGHNPSKTPADLDLLTPYDNYFGAAAKPHGQYWYSYDVGTWHVIVLDSNCADDEAEGCNGPKTAAMVEWLQADIAAANARCLAVTTHHNIIEQAGRSTFGSMSSLLVPLYDAGLDLWVSGHRHTYRRYAKINLEGEADPNGIRHLVAGTGGHPLNAGKVAQEGVVESMAAEDEESYGVLRLTLKPGGYDWNFVPAQGPANPTPFTDSGTDTCSTKPGQVDMAGTTETTATTQPQSQNQQTAEKPPAAAGRSGYWMVGVDGTVYEFGHAGQHGSATPAAGTETVDLEPTPTGDGYWLVDSSGQVTVHGDAVHHGSPSTPSLAAGEKVTSLSATPTGAGYWIFTTRGRVLTFGDAAHYGDMSKATLNGPVLDSIPTSTGQGYYMVAADGGIFAFGDAEFHGSMGDAKLNAPVQSLVPDPDGVGYWLVAADGGIFAFEAPFRGSMGSTKLNKPISGMVPFGNGYLMVGEDGGVFNFSDRQFHGSLGDRPPTRPIVSVAALH